MSGNDAGNDVSALYPAPPPYVRFFTDDNVARLEKQHEDGAVDAETALDSPQDVLGFLIPPPIPESQRYRAFGNVWQIKDELPDLEAMGISQLYKKSTDPASNNYQYKIQELRKLLKSLLLNYLELVGILSINPELYATKVEHIRTILVNMHHLLNAYRPHQSRESLIMLLENQVEHKKLEIKHIEEVCQQVQTSLKDMHDQIE